MLACPTCHGRLTRHTEEGVVFRCHSCGGQGHTVSLLRRRGADQAELGKLWALIREAPDDEGRQCPHCSLAMPEVSIQGPEGLLFLDGCPRCYFIWFDRGEYRQLPRRVEPEEPELPLEARRAIAVAAAEHVAGRAEVPEDEVKPTPFQWVASAARLPVVFHTHERAGTPYVTWSLCGALVLAMILSFGWAPDSVMRWGFIPCEWSRYLGLTAVTSFFVHGGVIHLLVNAYCLLAFGDNVEDLLGHARYGLLVLAATVAGCLTHGVFTSQPAIPLVGASAGVAGVAVFYAFAFPHARVGVINLFAPWRLIQIPVPVMLAIYAAGEWLSVALQQDPSSSVAHFAHLGGAAVGLAAGGLMRVEQERKRLMAS
jgi:membrane associated rhomboid family serine protease